MIKTFPRQLLNQVFLLGLGGACILFILNSQSIRKTRITDEVLSPDTYQRLHEGEALKLSFYKKLPTFGLDNLMADWSMLQFLQYFGDKNARQQTGYNLSADYLEVVTKRDPQFSAAYLLMSPASSLFGGTPERTVELMDRALENITSDIPYAYYLWVYKGMDEILFFNDLEKAQKSYEKALEWATIAEDETVIESAKNTIAFLETKPNLTDAKVGVWFTIWMNNQEPNIREIAHKNIEDLGGQLNVYSDSVAEAVPPSAVKLRQEAARSNSVSP